MRTNFTPEQRRDQAMASSEAVIRNCVHCGFCTATCPTYVLLGDELDSPRGRIYLMKEMLENQQQPTPQVVKHIDRCLSCMSCLTTCPSGVHYGHLIDHARTYIEANYRRPLLDRIMRQVLAAVLPYPARFKRALGLASLARPLMPILRRVKALQSLSAMLALAPTKPIKGLPTKGAAAEGIGLGRVAMLGGCAEPVLRPEIGRAAASLFSRMGYEVVVAPNAGCCGALVHHLGQEDAALASARRNVDAWIDEIEGAGLEAIIVTASGCGTMIKDYGFMLRSDPAYASKAERVSSLAMDICEFVAAKGLPPVMRSQSLIVAYQSACSLQHGQKVTRAPQDLLKSAGYEVRQPAEAHLCCGSAGTYNILQPVIAAKLGERKVAHLAKLSADVIATGNIGCATQISLRTQTPVVHTVQLLDWATGGSAPDPFSSHPS
jgi:glycolate oxidase iron-sulfur subunit